MSGQLYEIPFGFGKTKVEEHVYPLPPKQVYDVSVYELIVQSIAIDRTKPGGKIEDINISPKSVGIFPIPPGAALRDSHRFDAYDQAKRQNNTGAVRRIDLKQWKETSSTGSKKQSF